MLEFRNRVDSDKIICQFVDRWPAEQKSDHWRNVTMLETIGGSEMASILGENPYSSFITVVREKVNKARGKSRRTGVACYWGSFLEPVLGEIVERDLCSKIYGDKICVRLIDKHRNSPDGYCTIGLIYRDGQWNIRRACDKEVPQIYIIVLLEFKCPITRAPTLEVPKQYQSQVQSGLSVSAFAECGLFVDAVFRRCALADLVWNGVYDTQYHTRDIDSFDTPVAAGFFAIYCLKLDAPVALRMAGHEDDFADLAATFTTRYFGSSGFADELIDFGSCTPAEFDTMLAFINSGVFRAERTNVWYTANMDVQQTLQNARESCPEHYKLCGVWPWKLLSLTYIPVAREEKFMERAYPVVCAVLSEVQRALAAESPDQYIADLSYRKKQKRRQPVSAAELDFLAECV